MLPTIAALGRLWSPPIRLHCGASIAVNGDVRMSNNSSRPERPRLEPEIIPPRYGRRDGDWLEGGWSPYVGTGGTQRIYIARLGPFGLAIVMLVIGFVAAIILLATVGALLIWLPILAILLAVGVVFRRHLRR
jgi:hypothetical protein